MPSLTHTSKPITTQMKPADLVAQLVPLLQWLASTTFHLAIGLVLGLLAARTMRSRQLHWTWAAFALGGVLLVWPLIGDGLAFTFVMATLGATVRGSRWHREDLEAGADLAGLAVRRSRPFDVLRQLSRKLEWCLIARCFDGRAAFGHVLVGYDHRHRAVTIPLGGAGGGNHTLVLGATRSGKTVTMTSIVTGAIERGMGAIVLDPKGDVALRQTLHESALMAGRPFLEWTPEGPSVYNPYARGSDTEIADKALAGERFTEPHYLRQAQRYLGHEVRILRRTGVEVSLRTLTEYLDPARLEVLARDLTECEARGAHHYLDSLTPRQCADLAGVRDRLAILAESDAGAALDPASPDGPRLDMLEAIQARSVVYCGLESDRRPLLAQMLGTAMIQDLQTAVAVLQGCRAQALVAIDEFSAIGAERVAGLFARSAGAGVSLVLGTQELADLRLQGSEQVRDQIVGNLSTLIVHRQAVPASAELVARMTEAIGVWRTSRHGDRGVTRTREFERALRAHEVTGLRQGRAAVIDLAGGGPVSVTQISRPIPHLPARRDATPSPTRMARVGPRRWAHRKRTDLTGGSR